MSVRNKNHATGVRIRETSQNKGRPILDNVIVVATFTNPCLRPRIFFFVFFTLFLYSLGRIENCCHILFTFIHTQTHYFPFIHTQTHNLAHKKNYYLLVITMIYKIYTVMHHI